MDDDYEKHWQDMTRAARAIADASKDSEGGRPVQGYSVQRVGNDVVILGGVERLDRDGARVLAARLLLAAESPTPTLDRWSTLIVRQLGDGTAPTRIDMDSDEWSLCRDEAIAVGLFQFFVPKVQQPGQVASFYGIPVFVKEKN